MARGDAWGAATPPPAREPIPAQLRFRVLARDGFRCRDCGRTENEPGVELHLDHVIPVSRGGPTTEDNLITACNRCNLGKSNREILPNRDGWPQAAPEPGSGLDDSSPGIG